MLDLIKLYNKAVSLLLALIMLLSLGLTAYAEEYSSYDEAAALLVGLNIIDKDEPDNIVTRGKFADVFVKAMNIYVDGYESYQPFADTGNSEYRSAIEILHDRHYLNGVGDNNFAPEGIMRTEYIVRLYVCALGLEMYPQDGNMTFMAAGARLGLLKNVSYTDEITVHNLAVMTYNLLTEAPVGKAVLGIENSYTIDYNDTLLYENFKVVKRRGMVAENDISGVWSKSTVKDGYVKIKLNNGVITALDGDTGISDYLGYTLNIYIEYGDDDNRIICFEEKVCNDFVTINISDIYFESSTLKQIVYNSNGTTKKKGTADFPSVIFNGVYYDEGTFDLKTLEKYNGSLTLINSESESSYDIIKITAYTDYFVKNVEYYDGEMRIYDSGENDNLVLNENESEIKLYYPNGAEASIYELQANMLLSVLTSADNSSIIIYICDKYEEQYVTNVDVSERNISTKDGKLYSIAASCPITNIEIGKNSNIYFDYMGKIGWIEANSGSEYSYALMCSSDFDKKEDTVTLKTFVKSGEFTYFTMAEKAKIDGITYKTGREQYNTLNSINIKGFETGMFPIRYILDESGKIRNVDTPVYNKSAESKDSLKVCLEKSKTTSGVLFSSDGILAKKIVLTGTAKVFVLPEDSSMLSNIEMFNAGGRSLLATGKNSNIMAFKIKDDSLYADLVVNWKTSASYAEINHDNKLFLIDKVNKAYDPVTDELVIEVTGIEGGVKKTYKTYSEFDKSKLDGLSRGDIVRFAYYKGAIFNVEVVFKKDDSGENVGIYNQPSGANGVTNNEGNYDMYYCGYVRAREGKYLKIWTADVTSSGNNVLLQKTTKWENTDETSEEFRVVQATNIAVYDASLSSDRQVYVGDIEDIPYYEGSGDYAIVIMRYRSRSPQETIIIKQ